MSSIDAIYQVPDPADGSAVPVGAVPLVACAAGVTLLVRGTRGGWTEATAGYSCE